MRQRTENPKQVHYSAAARCEFGGFPTFLQQQVRAPDVIGGEFALRQGNAIEIKRRFGIIWNLKSGQETLTLRGHTHTVFQVAFSPDGHKLASASEDRTVRIWDATPLGE